MKKLLSFVVVAAMLFSAMSVFASAEDAVLYSNNFSATFAADNKSTAVLDGWAGFGYECAKYALDGDGFTQKIEGGKLWVGCPSGYPNNKKDPVELTTSSLERQFGARLGLYEVPSTVTSFTAVLEYTVHKVQTNSSNGKCGVGLIYSDNAATDYMAAYLKTEKNQQNSSFEGIFANKGEYGWNATYGGGAKSMTTAEGWCVDGEKYTIEITVPDTKDYENANCTFKITNRTNTQVEPEIGTFVYGVNAAYTANKNSDGSINTNVAAEKPVLGVYINGVEATLESFVVTGVDTAPAPGGNTGDAGNAGGNTGNTGNTGSTTTPPQTGDVVSVELFVALMVVSCAAAFVLVRKSRQH